MFTFLITYANLVILVVWAIFFCIVAVRFFCPLCIKNISYGWLVASAIITHFLYGVFLTWAQYFVWSKNEVTKIFLSSALPKEVPFPSFFEWSRPLFDGINGYFAFYSFYHFFLSTIILFFVTGLFVLFLKVYESYRPTNFQEGDIAVVALALLIVGWPNAVALVPLGFIIAIIITFYLTKVDQISLPLAFLLAVPITLACGAPILNFFHLYTLLKI